MQLRTNSISFSEYLGRKPWAEKIMQERKTVVMLYSEVDWRQGCSQV